MLETRYSDAGRNGMVETFLLTVLYGLFFYLFVFFLYKIEVLNILPDAMNLQNWDAGIYLNVGENGYSYPRPRYNNMGVFILFPLFCRLLFCNVWLVVAGNILLFAAGFTILSSMYTTTLKHKLVWLTTPAIYFMFVPYTEALFIFLMSISLYGIRNNNKWILIAGLFLGSLTRATAVFLLPALLIMELLSNDKKDLPKTLLRYILYYVLPIITAFFLFVWYEYTISHVWFVYVDQMTESQGHVFSIPKLPFSSNENNRNIWYSSLAAITDIVALISVAYYGIKWLIKKELVKDKVLILSLAYLGMTFLIMTFYNPKWVTGTTNVMGLLRYSFCTPFFFVFFHHFFVAREAYKPKQVLAVFLLCNLVWLSYGSYLHIIALLYYNFCFVFVLGYMLLANKKLELPAIVIAMLNVVLQVFLFSEFLNKLFPD